VIASYFYFFWPEFAELMVLQNSFQGCYHRSEVFRCALSVCSKQRTSRETGTFLDSINDLINGIFLIHLVQVIDYRMQQYRLFPLLATAYALNFTGKYMRKLFEQLSKVLCGFWDHHLLTLGALG